MNMYCLEERLNAGEVGNKAAFLSLMKRNGFIVPTGIVLGKDIFTKTISANDNKHEIDMLLEVLSKSNAKETSDKISELYSSVYLSISLTATKPAPHMSEGISSLLGYIL